MTVLIAVHILEQTILERKTFHHQSTRKHLICCVTG